MPRGALLRRDLYPGHGVAMQPTGTLGSARIAGNRLHVRYLSGETEEVGARTGSGGGADPMDFAPDAHCRLIVDFLHAIAEGRPPRASGREALRSQVLIDAILGKAATAR